MISNGSSILKNGTSIVGYPDGGWSGGDLIYDTLSSSAKTVYNTATTGNYISVSVVDYNNVFSALSSASKIGMTDSQFYESGSSWAGGCANILSSGTSVVSSGVYLVGYACYGTASPNTYTPLISTTFKGTYTGVSNSMTVSGSGFKYFIRKAPISPLPSTSYVGHVSSNGFRMGTTSYANGGHDCSAPYSTWTNWSSTAPVFQMFGTTYKQW